MPRTDPPLFAGLPYRRLSPAQRAALTARLVGARARPLTVGDMFSGGGGASVGARQAGLVTRWAVERDPAIAAVYRANLGEHGICADALELDPAMLEPVDVLWASPPCQDASVARSKRLPPHADAEVGRAVIGYVRVLRPAAVILENVPPYRTKPTFRTIVRGLSDLGYFIDVQIVNAADAGVPQRRHRLIMRAVLGGLVPPLPAPVPWVGWYAAIEDLLPTLPESKFAKWQLARLPWLAESTIVHPTADNERFPLGAGTEPTFTITCTNGAPRAYLVEGGNPTGHTLGVCPDRPAPTVQASASKQLARALLVNNQISADADAPITREAGEPAPGVTGQSGGRVRALLVNSSSDLGVRVAAEPAATVTATTHEKMAPPRAWLDAGRVVAMTPRALARFQSFPDWYHLPASKGLACRVVGNAAPPLLAQRLFEGLAAVLRARAEASA